MKFDDAFELVVGAEGIYSKDPRDNGNWTGGAPNKGELLGTKFGISAKSYGLKLAQFGISIRALTLKDAKQIYKSDFWNKLKCDLLPETHRYPLFSCAVNCGVKFTASIYQKCLKVAVDGRIGPITTNKANNLDPKEPLEQFYREWAHHYREIVASQPRQAVHLKGWLSRIDAVKKHNF